MNRRQRMAAASWALAGMLTAASSAMAGVESQVLRSVPVEQPPLDVAVSPDGRWTFVLVKGGEVQIFDAGGTLEGRLQVGATASAIAPSQRGDRIYVTDWDQKELRIVSVDFVHSLDVSGSPFKGPAEAPVIVAVYSDFQ